MSLHRYLPLLFFLQIALFAQTKLETEIEKIKDIPGITLEYLEGDRLSVNYDGIKTRVFYIGDKEPPNTISKDVPSFVFNIGELDTADFNHLFYLWQEVPVASSFFPPTIGDIDKDGRTEIYGYKKDFFSEQSEVYCYEQDNSGIFKSVHKYPENTIQGFGIYDIDRNGEKEIHLVATHFDSSWSGFVHDQTFFKSPSPSTLATEFYFDYNIYRGGGLYIQLNDFTIGDFDNDGINEAIFFNISPQQIWMTKFNEVNLTFDSLLSYHTWQPPGGSNEYIDGFIIGDFDIDNKTDIVYSSEYGNIYILEHCTGDDYNINWSGNSEIWNSYINFKTDDIDENGKPEFWVGGEDFEQGVTMITCFEPTGNNSYERVAKIIFPNLLSLNGIIGTAIDIDHDKREEIFIRVGNTSLLLKFIGSSNNHNYEVYYYYRANNKVFAADIYQFPNEDRPSIVMSMYESENGKRRDFSKILRHYPVTNILAEDNENLSNYHLLNNYPNPFNPSTIIKYQIPESGFVQLKVYNVLGKEVVTLVNEVQEQGSYSVPFDASELAAGVYLYSISVNDFSKSHKMLLLK